MKRRTFPKSKEQKIKDVVQKLKARVKYLEKKVKFYEHELLNCQKPVRARKSKVVSDPMELLRKEYLKQFRESLKGKHNE